MEVQLFGHRHEIAQMPELNVSMPNIITAQRIPNQSGLSGNAHIATALELLRSRETARHWRSMRGRI